MTTPNPLLLQERHHLILQQLQLAGRVLAVDLARQLQVSDDTIRRDLRDMAAAGLCQRVYGGALRLPLQRDDSTLAQRSTEQVDAKSRLAAAAVSVVAPGNIVFIDAGSTNLAIAAALPEVALTVITNAPAIATLLLERPRIEVIMIGGKLDARSGASLGATALRDVGLIRPDLFFLGACGVDAEAGVSAYHFEEAEFKRRVASVSKAVLVAATAGKLGSAAPYPVLAAPQLSYLVVGHDADPVHTAALSSLVPHLLRAAPPSKAPA